LIGVAHESERELDALTLQSVRNCLENSHRFAIPLASTSGSLLLHPAIALILLFASRNEPLLGDMHFSFGWMLRRGI
jgi:hypothetical protein